MRKLILAGLVAATLAPVMASAQTPELNRDRRDIREQRQDLRDAQAYGDRRDVRDERHDVRDAQREYREDRRDYGGDRRDDRREYGGDWRDYRRSNAGAFRQGGYASPYAGWRYRPVGVGSRFDRRFWGDRYAIADPYRYRLPRPLGYQRYYRYGNDVVLIDTRNGIVAQVFGGFFL